MIFGNENAENDALLNKCTILSMACPYNKNFITGRWGAGKTACLLIANKELNDELRCQSKKYNRIWYVDGEKDLNIPEIIRIFSSIQEKRIRLQYFQTIWKAEIIRRILLQLGCLFNFYGSPQGSHWSWVNKLFSMKKFIDPIWINISEAINIIASKQNLTASAENLQGKIKDFFTDASMRQIQKCLLDIKDHPIQPIVGIEPIDSPESKFDEEYASLSQELVTSLINCFEINFQPNEESQLFRVYLVIPWHRYIGSEINAPQKIRQYKNIVCWSKVELKEFINSRIKEEFNKVGREINNTNTNIDAWEILFCKEIYNRHCCVKEDTFDYILRHTFYRPRDLQRFARTALEQSAESNKCSTDEVLAGIKVEQIGSECIERAVSRAEKSIKNDVIIEVSRRYPEFNEISQCLMNVPVPFEYELLKERGLSIEYGSPGRKNLDILWKSGVLGVELSLRNSSTKCSSIRIPDELSKYCQTRSGETVRKWFVFSYNYLDGSICELITKYLSNPNVVMKFTVHPTTYDYLAAQVLNEYPIGV